MLLFKIFVCTFYGLASIAQTLNSRFLFKTLHFNFYSTVFLSQRLAIVGVNWMLGRKTLLPFKQMLYILPYSFIMCNINILSSFCVTVMPLAAYMAFKKFVVLFVLLVGIAMSLPNHFSTPHYLCIVGIVCGGLMIGGKDIYDGQIIGYVASLAYTLFEALSLQISQHLYESKGIGPQDLMVANSILSMPYYLFLIFYENQHQRVVNYLSQPLDPLFLLAWLFAIVVAFSSEYTANIISMKISPFQKASVSNIKDLVLTIISIHYFADFAMTFLSEIGIVLCLSASMMFSCTLIDKSEKEDKHRPSGYHSLNKDGINSEDKQMRDEIDNID